MGTIKVKKQVFVAVAILLAASFLVYGFMSSKRTPPTKPDEPGAGEHAQTGPVSTAVSQDSQGRIVAFDDSQAGRPWQVDGRDLINVPSLYKNVHAKRPGMPAKQYVAIDNEFYPLRTYQALTFPNDPYASQPWVANSNLSAVWDIAPSSSDTVLAIIDTGFALDHEEFVGRWHVNGLEQGAAATEASSKRNCTDRGLSLDYSCNLVDDNVDGVVDNESGPAPYENNSQLNCSDRGLALDKSCNLIDDDANSYVDDVQGWDMINQDNSPQAGELSPEGDGTMHGTMVSGVAAATGGNGKGIAGVNWQTRILPIQALDDDSYGDTFTVGKSIYYAIDQGADVINISLGSPYDDPYVRQAIAAATAKGILVVASSGNDGCDCVAYPARYPETLSVGATDQSNAIASFSSWGSSVDLVAPGTNYILPSWAPGNPTSQYVSGANGTSFSSPLVAGLAAQLKSRQPDAAPLHLIAALRETTQRTNISASTTHDTRYGYGRVDAWLAANRTMSSQHMAMPYVLSPIEAGGYFSGVSKEKITSYEITDCQTARSNISLYEATKGSERFFTVSEVELESARASGFTTKLFAYTCLRQPHDTSDKLRYINVFREFRNIDSYRR